MAELTLGDVKNYIIDNRYTTDKNCTDKADVNNLNSTIIGVDNFLLNQINTTTNSYNTSSTTKDNFLRLYNEQYERNMEAFIGILVVGGILIKMMFYPPKL